MDTSKFTIPKISSVVDTATNNELVSGNIADGVFKLNALDTIPTQYEGISKVKLNKSVDKTVVNTSLNRPTKVVNKSTKIVKKSERRFTKSSVERLRELGFDPLEKLVELYKHIKREIYELELRKQSPIITTTGEVIRYNSMAHMTLLATQQKLLNDLMRYGYARVPESINVNSDPPPGLTINLTPKGGKFDVDGIYTPTDGNDITDVEEVKDIPDSSAYDVYVVQGLKTPAEQYLESEGFIEVE